MSELIASRWMNSLQRGHWPILITALLLGVIVRLSAVFAGPYLANDEAALAISIESLSYAELTGRLQFGQAAPVGFLWLAKLGYQLLGGSTYAFRALPFVFAGIALALACLVARAVLPWRSSVAGLFLVAASGGLISYAGFFKQYSTDVAGSLLLIYLCQPFLRAVPRHLGWRELGALLVVGTILPWFSHPSVFVLAACGTCLMLRLGQESRWPELRALLAVALLWLLSFVSHYWLFARHLNQSGFLNEFWAAQLLPQPATPLSLVRWAVRSALDWSSTSLGISTATRTGMALASGAILLASLGWVALWKTDRRVAVLWLLPAGIAAAAAALRMYPFGGRLILFLVPVFLLLAGHGLMSTLRNRHKLAWLLLAIAVLFMTGKSLRLPAADGKSHAQQLAAACRYVANQATAGDRAYIFYPNRVACYYHLRQAGFNLSRIVVGDGDSPGPFGAVHHVESQLAALPLRQWQGLWAIFSHGRWRDGLDERDVVMSTLERACKPVQTVEFGEVRLVKFQCGGG